MTDLADLSAAANAVTPPPTPDFTAIKARQQATWASGDFAIVGTTLQIVGELLAEAADVRADERVLDVAAGNGNATLAAARRFARVTSTDYVPALLDKGRGRAWAEGLEVEFRVADVEALPFDDGEFDCVLSTFGSMFAPDHRRTAAEMLRVTRPGGRIGVASWTPDGFIGRMFKVVGGYVPPPAGVAGPPLWGTESHLREIFGDVEIRCTRRDFNFRYRSAAHMMQVFRDYYGPVLKAFAALDAGGQAGLKCDLEALAREADISGGASLVAPAGYLEAIIVKP
ncbi:class I SAM-dependent methyltransferase [Pseudoduganella sp. SL102]|uniref:class I SAM-dependent methyltransferase n=1 Tax=Pseudoduganella sp. SL102 TaxID=2995154 RepID=UPI00248CC5F1|nr:class I SAM-dependent methyltransferase [Pseudoduganella sp. SL102]WBS00357.1 class I SAM-dependent methyltransferase [Pseudoduganella sp. SL102]